jgi:hypothetical protein
MEEKLIQLTILVGIDCISMVVCGWKMGNKRRVFRNLDEEDNFGIIVKILINLGVTMII